jgi:nucleotide-binding universal stress UspA family protein
MNTMTEQLKAGTRDLGFEHILVPLDGSHLAFAALPTARALAERFGAALRTISVASTSDRAVRLFDDVSASLDGDLLDRHTVVVGRGQPGDEIARHADELGSCLVCLSTHARGRLSGAVFGSVARSVMLRSDSAIIALGPLADRPGWSPTPLFWPAPLSVSRIVACVDGSDASEALLPTATAWSRALGMSLTILSVVDDGPAPRRSGRRANGYGPTGDADTYITELVQKWQASAPGVNGLVLKDPIGPASAIRSYLAQQPAGLVAVRTHARSGLQRLRGGATAASIVRASVAPCLVVP